MLEEFPADLADFRRNKKICVYLRYLRKINKIFIENFSSKITNYEP